MIFVQPLVVWIDHVLRHIYKPVECCTIGLASYFLTRNIYDSIIQNNIVVSIPRKTKQARAGPALYGKKLINLN
jgi:hypothetical protein